MSRTHLRVKVPPLKIQGIKTKLVPFIMKSVTWDGTGRWIEPFLGSGVVAFNTNPKCALLADTNEHIIRFYQALQEGEVNPYSVRQHLETEGAVLSEKGEKHYYFIRERFNEEHSPFDFLFLNRSCFNGMMRFNSSGKFNVPFCRKPERFAPAYVTKICNQVAWVGERLAGKDWVFVTQDWRDTLSKVKDDDFVYLDPPYNDRHTDYYNQWSNEEADELAECVKRLEACFAFSTWKENKYRYNEYLDRHFSEYPVLTKEHFYHVGAKESLRNAMEEALVIAPHCEEAMETKPTCDWPGCSREALCTSGNAGGAFVCEGHFTITNGTCAEELSTLEMAAMRVMARRADRRHTQNER